MNRVHILCQFAEEIEVLRVEVLFKWIDIGRNELKLKKE